MDEMIGALREQGHQVVLVGPARGGQETEFGSDAGLIAVLKQRLPRALYEVLEAAYNIPAFLRLFWAYWQHRPDFIYERYNLFMFAGIWLKRLTGVPLVLEVNGPIYEERSLHDGLSLRRFAAWSQGVAWRGADYALPVTEVLAGYMRRYGVKEDRIAVIPNGINPSRFSVVHQMEAAKARLGLQGRLVLGFTGFIRGWNALGQVIELLAREGEAHNLHLLIVGDGPARQEMEQLAAARNVSGRLTITGVIDRDHVVDYVSAFDIALIPGVTEYASPLKLFEYMALGRAVIAPDMANIREILTNEENAVLFVAQDSNAFANAIIRLCADPVLRQRIASNAQAAIEVQGLTWARNAARVVNLARGITGTAA